jgi:hypothetical protein
MHGNASSDAKYAFSDDNNIFEDKKSFCQKYNPPFIVLLFKIVLID